MPKVSVVINTYNSAAYIIPAIESVLAQTFTDYELIVVDDGSTDNTRQVLQPYASRLTYIYQENKKYSAARNTGIRAAAGDYIAFLDSDDIWCADKLERQVPVLWKHPQVSLVHCQFAYMNPAGEPIQFRGKHVEGPNAPGLVIADRSQDLFSGTIVSTSTVIVRRSALDQTGLFDEQHIHGEDWELWVRLAATGPFAYLPEPLTRYRFYGWNKILTVESSEPWLADQLKTIKTAAAVWKGDPGELERLRNLGLARIYIRAMLSSYQTGKLEQAQVTFAKAILADPTLVSREALVQLAVDRGKEIEAESGSLQPAETFIRTLFSHLPASVSQHSGAYKADEYIRQALGWLYVGVAFERHTAGDRAAARRLLAQGIQHWPLCLKNRGVLSVGLQVWLGKSAMAWLKPARNT